MSINSVDYLFEFILSMFFFLFFFLYFHAIQRKDGLPTKWPLVGAFPALLKNIHRLHDGFVELMEKTALTFLGEGPWFTNMKLLLTCDPENVHHIFVKNFGNYPKGSKFKEIFDAFGDGIFNSDSELWKYHRKMALSIFAHPRFNQFLAKKTWEKIATGLIPILDHACKNKSEIELQDLFGRLTYDVISTIIMDCDPGALSIDMPNLPFLQALLNVKETFVSRHLVPSCVWKFQRWLGIGQEKKYKKASKIIDDFIYGCISRKREENSKTGTELGINLMAMYMEDEVGDTDKILRDTIVNLLAAGRGPTSVALSWFFYLLSKNQHVLSKLKAELDAATITLQEKHHDHADVDVLHILSTNFQELSNRLIYLHAAILEALRLYPPVPFNAKAPVEAHTIPSGHRVDQSTEMIFSMYAMGRMKSIWGEDCYEFKPERWILETGKLKYVPSHKFFSYSAGPRTCLGKNMSLVMMKAVITAIISQYRVEPVQGHPVVPCTSIVLHMKYGFKVNVVKNR